MTYAIRSGVLTYEAPDIKSSSGVYLKVKVEVAAAASFLGGMISSRTPKFELDQRKRRQASKSPPPSGPLGQLGRLHANAKG